METIIKKIKGIFLNRNTTTILVVFAGVVALWMVYSITLDKAVKPIQVPVANKDLIAGTQISSEDFDLVEINNAALSKTSVITDIGQITGFYVNNGTSIPKGGLFYSSKVVDKDKLIERDLETIPENYTMYWLKVNNSSTYANSIYPGDKIDLWLETKVDGMTVYEPFITSIEVLSVKDSSGKNVFDGSGKKEPQWIAFAVKTEMYTYLSKISSLGMELNPVPKNKMYTEENAEVAYANENLKAYIDSLSVQVTQNTADSTAAAEKTNDNKEN